MAALQSISAWLARARPYDSPHEYPLQFLSLLNIHVHVYTPIHTHIHKRKRIQGVLCIRLHSVLYVSFMPFPFAPRTSRPRGGWLCHESPTDSYKGFGFRTIESSLFFCFSRFNVDSLDPPVISYVHRSRPIDFSKHPKRHFVRVLLRLAGVYSHRLSLSPYHCGPCSNSR